MLPTVGLIIEIVVSTSLLLWTKHAWDIPWIALGVGLIAFAFVKQLWLEVGCIGIGIFTYATLSYIDQRYK